MTSKSAFSKTSRGDSQHVEKVKESIPGEASGSMQKALSSFLAARVELASIEIGEAIGFAAGKAVHGIILGFSVFFTWALILAGLTGVLAPIATELLAGEIAWLPGWTAVLFGLAIPHGIVAVIFFLFLRKKSSSPLFKLSRQEIENDKQWLVKNK